jgi:bacillithiol biosynthesis deacetylase BshB1
MSDTPPTDAYGLDVLAFGPHPDDVELFCGGTLIRLADLGHRTGVVDLTRGERASLGTPETRARECEAASAVLGLRLRENLGLPDTGLDAGDAGQLARVVGVLRRLRPELVLAPWIEERHPDHVAASALVHKAVFYAGVTNFPSDPPAARFVPRQLFFYQLRHRMPPTFVVDTSAAAARKAQAIACYQSQVTRRPGDAPTLLSSNRALDAIEARDRWVGSLIGASHGEALRAPNVPGLVDPLRHVRDNPFAEAHAFEPLA